ncbi:MAG: PAS domain-containing protein [Candidatus Magnetominusculus sp. LBB02]|nr:PAS domain-containing protein [Candidatus Magnetominusculus sp. LBB02]
MTIKTKIQILVIMPVLALAVVTALFLLDSFYDNLSSKREAAVTGLIKNTFDTVIITNDILVNGRVRGIHQLEVISSLIAGWLSKLDFKEHPQLDIVNDIAADHKEIKTLCIVYYNIFFMSAQQSQEFINQRNIVSSQLFLQAYSIVMKALYLRDIVHREEIELTNRLHKIIISVMGLSVVIIGFVSIKLGRDIINGLTRVQKGIETISGGDLNYLVPNDIHDEIGELIARFNMMSKNLKETYLELNDEISKRKMSEESLRESQNKLNMALEAAELGDWERDLITGAARRSLKHAQIFGYKELLPEWTFPLFIEHVHPDDRARVAAVCQDAVDKDHDLMFECRINRTDNVERWIWVRGRNVKDDAGKPVRIIGILQDITERKNLETKLEEIRVLLQSIIDSSSAVIFLKNMEGRYMFINSRYEQLFHVTKDGVVGKTDYDIFPKELADNLRANDMEAARKKESLNFEEIVPHDDGLHTYISIKFPMIDSKGQMYGVCSIATDITDRKRMEEELKQLNTNLELMVAVETQKRRQHEQLLIQQSKMAAMGEMLGMIAHQWKQPLNALSLSVQDLKDAYYYGELNEHYINNLVDITTGQIMFMSKTISDFRNFFQPSKEKSRFNVKTAIDDLILMFGHLFKANIVDISVRVQLDVEPAVFGYPNEFKQVILNILNNAGDAIVSKRKESPLLQGLIEITISAENGKLIVSVTDNGVGIPQHMIEKIFDNYYTTKAAEGTGIGLYMSKTIIETNMGGSLTARNVDGGAEFLIVLGIDNGLADNSIN